MDWVMVVSGRDVYGRRIVTGMTDGEALWSDGRMGSVGDDGVLEGWLTFSWLFMKNEWLFIWVIKTVRDNKQKIPTSPLFLFTLFIMVFVRVSDLLILLEIFSAHWEENNAKIGFLGASKDTKNDRNFIGKKEIMVRLTFQSSYCCVNFLKKNKRKRKKKTWERGRYEKEKIE